MHRCLPLLALAACTAAGADPTGDDPFAVLRDPSSAWSYELVAGPSLEALKPIAGAPHATCKIVPSDREVMLDCGPVTRPDRDYGRALDQRRFLMLGKEGVREGPSPGSSLMDDHALAFTFPRTPGAKPWTYDKRDDDTHSVVRVTSRTAEVLGKKREVWRSEGTYTTIFDRDDGPTVGVVDYAPRVGPVLLCHVATRPQRTYSCLRLLGTAAPAPEPFSASDLQISKLDAATCRSQAEAISHELASADHEGQMLDLEGTKLVARPELTRPTVFAPAISITARGATLAGAKLDAAVLAKHHAEAVEAAQRYRSMGVVEPGAIYILADEDATWGAVVGAVNAAAGAGFDQPWFVFLGRAPTPPPRTKTDGALDAIRNGPPGEISTRLAKVLSAVTATCPAMTRVFGELGSTESGSKADQLIAGIATALPECHCNVDMAAFRTVMWRFLVNEHPATMLAVHVARDGKAIALPASTPWRDAHKQLTKDTKTVALRVR